MKFYFTPLKSKTRIKNEVTVNITKTGCLFFGKWALINLGLNPENSFMLSLYEDSARRTLGLKFSDKIDLDENKIQRNVRLVKPFKTKQGAIYAQVGIKPFLALIDNLHLPCNRIEVKEYKDAAIGQMWYVTLPESSNQTTV